MAQPLSARSIVLSMLLGIDPPEMSAKRLVQVTGLFGVAEGTTRTALSRMADAGELTRDDNARYRLADDLLLRQRRQLESRYAETVDDWNGQWRIAVVTGTHDAATRAGLRRDASLLRLAEQREGVWCRPDNLDPLRLPAVRARMAGSLYWYSAHPDQDSGGLAAALWDLDDWSDRARTLRAAMHELITRLEDGDVDALAPGFVAAADVLRHLQADPLLPRELLPRSWNGDALRRDYERYERAYRALLRDWFASVGDGDDRPVG